MNKYEKDIMKLLETHEKARKSDLIDNINHVLREKGISRSGKNQWICEVTGSPLGTVGTWFTKCKKRAVNKIPLYAMCQIAAALHISVWDLLKEGEMVQEDIKVPDRRSKLYWHIRRNEAEKCWNESETCMHGEWKNQSLEVQRDFLDKLYWESVEKLEQEEKKDE